MATILFFNQPEQGHINPTLPLVAELVRRGDRVIYYSLEDFKQAIAYTGATFQSYGEAYPFDHTRADEIEQFMHGQSSTHLKEKS